MPDQYSATPRNDTAQLDRIEAKLDAVLAWRDQIMGLVEAFAGKNKMLALLARRMGGE